MIIIKKKYLLGVVFIFALGSFLHFTYELTNGNFIVGLFSAQNESVFEHTKLLVLPIFLWYILTYNYTKTSINKEKYFTSMLISLLTSIVLIPLIYYFVTKGLNIENAIINISIFFVSALFGQLLAYHYYKYGKREFSQIFIIFISLILIGIYIYFSVYPGNLPIFIV